MELDREQIYDILDKMDFFQGQRAGRELWNKKPFDVQEQDIANFSRDVALIKRHINELTVENESLKQCMEHEHASFMETFGEYGEKCESLEIELNAMRTAANSYKMHYEKLEAENERLKKENEWYAELEQGCFVTGVKNIIADTVRKMQEMFDNRVKDKFSYHGWYLKETIMPSIAKEMLNDEC